MKLKTKLIPLLTVTGIGTIVAPISLTSCSKGLTPIDLLNTEYKSKIKPHEKATIQDQYPDTAISAFYENKIANNPAILADDILWTWSHLLHDEASRQVLDQLVKYTVFAANLNVSLKTVWIGQEWTDVTDLHLVAHIAGENFYFDTEPAYMQIDGKSIQNFDFSYDLHFYSAVHCLWSNPESEQDKDIFASKHPDDNVMGLSWTGYSMLCDITLNGNYTFKDETNVNKIENYRELSEGSPFASIFSFLVYGLPNHCVEDEAMNKGHIVPNFVFISHYLQNITIIAIED